MLENLRNFFKKMGKKEEDELLPSSSDAAKERLHLVLMQDRANVSVDFLDLIKREIIDVIKKYIDIDENGIDVRFTNQINEDGTNGAPALYANIPIVAIRNDKRSEFEKIKQKENELEAKTEKNDKQESSDNVSNLANENIDDDTNNAGKKSTKKIQNKDGESENKNETVTEKETTKKENNDGKVVRKVSKKEEISENLVDKNNKKEEKDSNLEDKNGKKEENTTSKKVASATSRKKATTTIKRKTVSEATPKKTKV